MKVVLGLDPSQTSTGWSVFREGADQPLFGHLDWPSWGDDEATYIEKFHRFLTDLVKEHGVTHICYEQSFIPVRKKGVKNDTWESRFPQLALITVILLVSKQYDCKVFTANIRSWRKRFIGTAVSPPQYGAGTYASTKWFKDRAMATANRRGWWTSSHDEAEALGIGDYGMCCIDPKYTEMTRAAAAREQLITHEIMRDER